MAKYVLTNKAVRDLAQIWNYTFDTWSEKQADKYYNEILKFCADLAKNPSKGKDYSALLQGLRGEKIHKHIVFFRSLEPNIIEIERVLHERMDLKSRLMK